MTDWLFTPETLVYAAGVFYILGLLIIHQITLRLLVLTGTCFYMFYYITVGDTPLWEALYISILIGIANVIGLAGLLVGRSKLAVPRKHIDIYPLFSDLPPGAFRKLMRKAKRTVLEQDTVLTVENEQINNLYFVISGHTLVEKMGDRFDRPSGMFVGEVAYLMGHQASATTTLAAGSEVLMWNSAELRAAASRSTQFMLALGSILSQDMARKVSASVVPTHAPHPVLETVA